MVIDSLATEKLERYKRNYKGGMMRKYQHFHHRYSRTTGRGQSHVVYIAICTASDLSLQQHLPHNSPVFLNHLGKNNETSQIILHHIVFAFCLNLVIWFRHLSLDRSSVRPVRPVAKVVVCKSCKTFVTQSENCYSCFFSHKLFHRIIQTDIVCKLFMKFMKVLKHLLHRI